MFVALPLAAQDVPVAPPASQTPPPMAQPVAPDAGVPAIVVVAPAQAKFEMAMTAFTGGHYA